MSLANETQIGGSHYKEAAKNGEQHWDMMWRLYKEVWFVGNITKYVLRYKSKNGLEDLKKAQHYLAKLIELEEAALKETEIKPTPSILPTLGKCIPTCIDDSCSNGSKCNKLGN